MKLPKRKPSNKKLKSTKTLQFINRETLSRFDGKCKEIYDHFLHHKSGIVVTRVMSRFEHSDRPVSQYVHWECEEFGVGTGNLEYWIKFAERYEKKKHDNL